MGDPERAHRSAASARSAATSPRRRARGRSSGSSPATTPRSTRAGSATRAASATRTCTPRTASRDPLRKIGKRRFEELSWDDALDQAEQLLRERAGPARALRLGDRRAGAGAREARPPGARLGRGRAPGADGARAGRATARRSPRSATPSLVVVIGDDPVEERAPVVELWIRAARRNGVEVDHGRRSRDASRPRPARQQTSSGSRSGSRSRTPSAPC